MQFIVTFTPHPRFADTGPPDDFMDKEMEERHQAKVLYNQGSIRQLWALSGGEEGAVVLFEAESREHLQPVIDTFPFVELEYCQYVVRQLAPYPFFSDLSS